MTIIPYRRVAAVDYARKWAMARNPRFYDFEKIGGDCTNFASQCIHAGSGIMNESENLGWYYRSPSDRAPSWTGVEYLFRFLTGNSSVGPFGHIVSRDEAMPGDIVQLGTESGHFYHCPVIVETRPEILVAAHSFDTLNRKLESYQYGRVRFIHIDGVRIW